MSNKPKKKKSNYNKQKYPSFNVKYQVGVRKELLSDIDYIDKLSEEEKEWLNKFLQETVVANFNHGGDPIIKDQKTRREIYRENNRRNKDVYSLGKSKGSLFYNNKEADNENQQTIDSVKFKGQDKSDTENFYNTLITIKDTLRKK